MPLLLLSGSLLFRTRGPTRYLHVLLESTVPSPLSKQVQDTNGNKQKAKTKMK